MLKDNGEQIARPGGRICVFDNIKLMYDTQKVRAPSENT